MKEILEITLQLASTCEALHIPYLVGGSIASSFHGIPRATLDADVLAFLDQSHVGDFVSRLKGEFYVDEAMIRDAIDNKGSFNVIHLATMFKVDIFVTGRNRLSEEEMARRQEYTMDENRMLFIASPEDIVVQKLYWYRLGGQVSERQWNDAQGVIKVQGDRLDTDYMRRIAQELKVEDLLKKSLGD